MADVFSKEQRSAIMRQVKANRNRSTELKLIDFFKTNKIKGWRRNYKLFGRPDFVFPTLRTVVFVDGCFWHGHDCRNTKPHTNKDYWTKKIERNKQRDKYVTRTLKQNGWTVIRVWECELKNENRLTKLLKVKLSTLSNVHSSVAC